MAFSLIEYLKRGPSTSKEIQAALGQSQATVSRLIKKEEDHIVQILAGRSIRYAATQNAFNSNDRIPLSIIDEKGRHHTIAYIRPLNCGGFFLEPVMNDYTSLVLLLGEKGNGWFGDLPYFLYDLRPQGFLGRQIARRIAERSDEFPPDPRHWNSDHIGRYLISNGDDLPGNFIFGEQALLRIRQNPAAVSEHNYPEAAKKVIEGEVPGSSAGGEQPKFTAYNEDRRSHVIVKFAQHDGSEASTRWKDILVTEFHAAEVTNQRIFSAAIPRLLEIDGWMFLETPRFDRVDLYGRKSMLSLFSLDQEFVGLGSNWARVMKNLHKRNLVSEVNVQHAENLRLFGLLINNTDMHLGNLSLSTEDEKFRLLPVYDMCSMGFAPKSSGILPSFSFEKRVIHDIGLLFETVPDSGLQVGIIDAAREFWERVAADNRISAEFRAFLHQGNPIDHIDF